MTGRSPLMEAAESYLAEGRARFHMPGHKGTPLPPVGPAAAYDLTEIPGLDSLYAPDGAIAETETRFASLYGAGATLLSAGGSTLCIQTMLALALPPGGELLCVRDAHGAAISAMALLDLRPHWIYPEIDAETGLSRAVRAEEVEAALAAHPNAGCVYLTSPNYFGVMPDIAAIAVCCHRHGVPLLVDGAHGAHLRFLPGDLHPIAQGADFCCDSLHKTLPALTGASLLHLADGRLYAQAKRRMSLFGSTSPSYLILLSAEGLLPWLEGEGGAALAAAAERCGQLEREALARGFWIPRDKLDPLRLSLGFTPLGYDAAGFRAQLLRCGVEPEYLAESFCVFLPGADSSDEDFARLRQVIESSPPIQIPDSCGARQTAANRDMTAPEQALSLREATFAPAETLPVERAVGRICAGAETPCPPGIPLVLPGERLDKNLCNLLKGYGISTINVVQ